MYALQCNDSIKKASSSNECAQESNIASRSRWVTRNQDDFYESESDKLYSVSYFSRGLAWMRAVVHVACGKLVVTAEMMTKRANPDKIQQRDGAG